jgi:GTPase SAR1 family protein
MKNSEQISFTSNRNALQKYKVVLVGDQSAGKSSIIIRYIKNEFDKSSNVPIQPLSQPSASTSPQKT